MTFIPYYTHMYMRFSHVYLRNGKQRHLAGINGKRWGTTPNVLTNILPVLKLFAANFQKLIQNHFFATINLTGNGSNIIMFVLLVIHG